MARPASPARRVEAAALAVVAAGGALGTLARHAVALAVPVAAQGFPLATLVANVTGSALLGLVLSVTERTGARSRLVRPLLATGFCGAYTTFSTLVVEVDLLVRDGRAATGAAYLALTLALGLPALELGRAVGRAQGARP